MAGRGRVLCQQRLNSTIELVNLLEQVVLPGIEFVEQRIVRSDLRRHRASPSLSLVTDFQVRPSHPDVHL